SSYLAKELGPQAPVSARLTSLGRCIFPVVVVETDSVYEIGPRLSEAKCGEIVARFRINGQKLAVAPAPNPTEKFECEKQVLLVGCFVDEDGDPTGADANVEETLGHRATISQKRPVQDGRVRSPTHP